MNIRGFRDIRYKLSFPRSMEVIKKLKYTLGPNRNLQLESRPTHTCCATPHYPGYCETKGGVETPKYLGSRSPHTTFNCINEGCGYISSLLRLFSCNYHGGTYRYVTWIQFIYYSLFSSFFSPICILFSLPYLTTKPEFLPLLS